MVIYFKKTLNYIIGTAVLAVIITVLCLAQTVRTSLFEMGGSVHIGSIPEQGQARPVSNVETKEREYTVNGNSNDNERFQRPSKEPSLKLKYSLQDFVKYHKDLPKVQIHFEAPEDVIHAYYAILKEASNMTGYHGGCGTVGMANEPYLYAYDLLSSDTRKKMSLDQFVDSFMGIGHITLLKLHPAYRPQNTPDNIRYFFVEIEVITGPPYKGKADKSQPSYFAYYYGLITIELTASEGWKVKTVDYIPEDFLCAPYHFWDWDAKAVVEIIYEGWYKVIDRIVKIKNENKIIHVYAGGTKEEYMFDFVRLSNGEDVMLHEYIKRAEQWSEVNLLKDEHQFYKFSILNPKLY